MGHLNKVGLSTFVKIHLLLKLEGEELFEYLAHLFLKACRNWMVGDLEKTLGSTCLADHVGASLHSFCIAG